MPSTSRKDALSSMSLADGKLYSDVRMVRILWKSRWDELCALESTECADRLKSILEQKYKYTCHDIVLLKSLSAEDADEILHKGVRNCRSDVRAISADLLLHWRSKSIGEERYTDQVSLQEEDSRYQLISIRPRSFSKGSTLVNLTKILSEKCLKDVKRDFLYLLDTCYPGGSFLSENRELLAASAAAYYFASLKPHWEGFTAQVASILDDNKDTPITVRELYLKLVKHFANTPTQISDYRSRLQIPVFHGLKAGWGDSLRLATLEESRQQDSSANNTSRKKVTMTISIVLGIANTREKLTEDMADSTSQESSWTEQTQSSSNLPIKVKVAIEVSDATLEELKHWKTSIAQRFAPFVPADDLQVEKGYAKP